MHNCIIANCKSGELLYPLWGTCVSAMPLPTLQPITFMVWINYLAAPHRTYLHATEGHVHYRHPFSYMCEHLCTQPVAWALDASSLHTHTYVCCCVDLVSNLTIPEMVGQLGNGAASIERLDIPNYQWWSEALHGLAGSPGISFKGKVQLWCDGRIP